jgi:hypothetical protein
MMSVPMTARTMTGLIIQLEEEEEQLRGENL